MSLERLRKLSEMGDVGASLQLLREKLRRGELILPEPAAQVVRECCRCKQALTDPVSREAGIGPVCRKRTNAAFARAKSADVSAARGSYKAFLETLSECSAEAQFAVVDVGAALFEESAVRRKDWRDVVQRIEWVLSFGVSDKSRSHLEAVGEALGYDVLVSMWRQMVVKGKASLSYVPERHALRLVSPRPCREVRNKLRSEGRFVASAWEFSAAKHDAVRELLRYFLVVSGVEEALGEAAKGARAVASEGVSHEEQACEWTIESYCSYADSGELLIRTPYNRSFVDAIKTLPRECRRWDSVGYAWVVRADRAEEAVRLVREHYMPSTA